MGDIETKSFDRLLTVLETNATSNANLAKSVESLATEVKGQGEHLLGLSLAAQEQTVQVKRLCDEREATAKARATRIGKVGEALWSVTKSPVAAVLMALAGWVIYSYFNTPAAQ